MVVKSNTGLLLGAGLTAASNPDPNTLGVSDPYGTPTPAELNDVSAGWVAQGKNLMVPKFIQNEEIGKSRRVWVRTEPSVPAATFDLTIWFYEPIIGNWSLPTFGSTVSFGGGGAEYLDFIELFPFSVAFFQVSNVSAGTVSIYVDGRLVEVR